jgi:hypothetical protein
VLGRQRQGDALGQGTLPLAEAGGTDPNIDDEVDEVPRQRGDVLGLRRWRVGELQAAILPWEDTDTLVWMTSMRCPMALASLSPRKDSWNTPRSSVNCRGVMSWERSMLIALMSLSRETCPRRARCAGRRRSRS